MGSDALHQGLERVDPAKRSSLASWEQRDELLTALFDYSPRGIFLTGPEGLLRECNACAARMLGYEPAELRGKRFNDITHPDDGAIGLNALREFIAGTRDYAAVEKRFLRKDGSIVWVHLDIVVLRDADGKVRNFVTSIDDLTERKRAETERLAAQERLITAQREALRQLSMPLMPIAEGVLALPLIGAIDHERALLMLDALLAGVAQHRAAMVIVDISGVATVGIEVAKLLVQMTQALRLLGAEVLLAGVRAEVAQRLVALGSDLSGLRTVGSFQTAIALALSR